MALAATVVWEVRTAGSDTACSGGFVAGGGGTDYSQQNAAQYTGTDLVLVTSTTISSATHNFVAADVGNLIQITAGTNFTVGFYQIVSVAANVGTIDRSGGTTGSTGGTFAVGGALATPGLAVANIVAGHTIYAKGAYTTTTNTQNVAGGRLNFTVSGTQTAINRLIGYTTTRGDNGKYTITLGATFTGPVIQMNNANSYNQVFNVDFVGNATSASQAANLLGRSNWLVNTKVSGFGAGGAAIVSVDSNALIKDFEISGGATGTNAALSLGSTFNCTDGWVHGNAGRGVVIASAACTINRVISAEHTGANGYGFMQIGYDMIYYQCAAWNNASGDFFLQSANTTAVCIRCVSGGGGLYNFDNRSGPDAMALYSCAAKANTSGLYPVTPTVNVGLVTLTGDPWTNRTAGDFSPDNTANEGAALRGVSSVLFGLTTTYSDVGPAQHQESTTGGTGPMVFVSSGAGSRGGSW